MIIRRLLIILALAMLFSCISYFLGFENAMLSGIVYIIYYLIIEDENITNN